MVLGRAFLLYFQSVFSEKKESGADESDKSGEKISVLSDSKKLHQLRLQSATSFLFIQTVRKRLLRLRCYGNESAGNGKDQDHPCL